MELIVANFCKIGNDKLPEKNQYVGSELGGGKKLSQHVSVTVSGKKTGISIFRK